MSGRRRPRPCVLCSHAPLSSPSPAPRFCAHLLLPGWLQEEMMAVLRDGIAHHPDELELYLTLGHVLERRGDTDAALEVHAATDLPTISR